MVLSSLLNQILEEVVFVCRFLYYSARAWRFRVYDYLSRVEWIKRGLVGLLPRGPLIFRLHVLAPVVLIAAVGWGQAHHGGRLYCIWVVALAVG